jgi:thiol-disulfide isomerase/thioredoxin
MNLLMMWVMSMTVSNSFAEAPDFTIAVYQQGSIFGLVLTPPADHHFNIQAPYSASVDSKKIKFDAAQVEEQKIVFEKTDNALAASDEATATAFLCDDAKTYCVKKKTSIALKPTIAKPVIKKSSPAPKVTAGAGRSLKIESTAKKDEHGFWNNAQAEAIQESIRTKKPILIDFYGIWCPPCNQYNESVFPTSAFKEVAKNYVLLKMDADAEPSWALKSRFKIGGYPTLLVMKAPAEGQASEVAKFEEIDRIVGFFPTAELVKKMKDAYANRNERFEDRILSMKANYLDGLQKLIESKWEQKDYTSAVAFAEEGLKTRPDDLYFQLIKLQGQARENPKVLKDRASLELLSAIHEKRKTLSVETLMRADDLVVSNSDEFKTEHVTMAMDLLDTLAERVNPKTLIVEGYELSLADINALKYDVADATKNEAAMKQARAGAIDAYQKLIAQYGKKEARGLNLELAYWLWNDGRVDEAKKIYDGFIKKYPKEFTFYFASAKMNLDLKKYPEAKAQIEKAVEYSYGDNHLRSMERLVRIYTAAGEPKVGIEKANALLAKVKSPEGYFIRTDRYIVALKKAVDDAQKKL